MRSAELRKRCRVVIYDFFIAPLRKIKNGIDSASALPWPITKNPLPVFLIDGAKRYINFSSLRTLGHFELKNSWSAATY